MKKLIGCLLVFLLGVGATLGYFAWRDRAESRDPAVLDVQGALEVREKLNQRVTHARQRDGSSQIVLADADLEALVTSALAEHPKGEDLVRVVREVRTEIGDDELEVGVAIDLAAVERTGLVDAEELDRVLGFLPLLGGQDLYVGFRGVPGANGGKITLVDDLRVTLGILTVPVDDLAERFGFSAEAVYSNLEFDLEWLRVEEVRARENQLTLEVRVSPPDSS